MKVTVDSTDPTPPFEQLREQIAALVLAGELAAGSRLPPIRQLAADLGLSPGTVARAYSELEAAGTVVTGRGHGTRVAPRQATTTTAQSAADTYISTARAAGLDLTAMLALVRVRYPVEGAVRNQEMTARRLG